MVCVYTFPNGDVVRGKPALKAYLTENLATLLPERAAQAGFKRSPVAAAVKAGATEAQVRRVEQVIANHTTGWANNPRVVVVADMNDPRIPAYIREANASEQAANTNLGQIRGFYHEDTLFMVASQLETDMDTTQVLFHEGLGHYGLRGVFGEGLNAVLQQVVALRKKDVIGKINEYQLSKNMAEARAAVLKDNPDLKGQALEEAATTRLEEDYLEAAEEVLADMAMTTPQIGFVKRAIAAIRTWLRQNVKRLADMELSDDEIIRNYILPARAFVEQGSEAGRAMARGTRMSRTDTSAFKKWFGNSKVVDAKGKPMVMYHGTDQSFDTFQPKNGMIFVSPKAEFASDYISYVPTDAKKDRAPNIMPVFVRAENPFDYENKSHVAEMVEHLQSNGEFRGVQPGFFTGGHWENLEDKRVQKALKDLGFDGFYVHEFGIKNLGVFDPTQIKSAIGNNGEYSSTNPDIRYNRAQPKPSPAPAGLVLPEQGFLRRVQASVQDSFNRVRQVQERITEITGQPIAERSNYYGAETNRPGRIAARLEDAKKRMIEPLMAKLAKSGHSMEELSSLLHAMHAEERNAIVAKINPDMPDGGSGMTNADANAILDKYKGNKELHAMARWARRIARATLDLKLAYGLTDEETYTTLTEVYENYVPLKGDGEYGPKVKRAMGHDEREEHILENIARDYEQAVVSGEKNLARQALLSMVLENPDPELWTVGVPPKGRYVAGQSFNVYKNNEVVASFQTAAQANAWVNGRTDNYATYTIEIERGKFTVERDGKPVAYLDSHSKAEKYIDTIKEQAGKLTIRPTGEQVREFVKPLQNNEVMVYVEGKPVRIQIIGDDKLAAQLRPLNAGQMNPILEFMRGTNRWLSKVYTGYNPAFIIKNTARDAMTGTINIMGNEGAAVAAKAWAKYPASLKALTVYAATGKMPAGEMGKMLQEYRQHGGKTGASYMSDLEEQGKNLQRMFDDAYGAKGYLADGKAGKAALIAGRKIVGGMAHSIEVLNQATENALRLALYTTMRQQGSSAGEAAQAAKSVTVDFDRKGAMSPELGAIYLFFNPAVQGTANALKTLFKGAKKEQAWMALGALSALGFYAASSGMDDDKDRWLGEGWESRAKNMMFNIGGHTIKVPVSLEFAPFYAFGVAMAEAKRGAQSKMATAGHVVSSFIDAYFPLQGVFNSESDNHAMDAAMATVPTMLKPGVQIAANRNSFGSQVVPENEFTKDRPDNLKMFRGTKGTAYDAAAQGIAKVGEPTGAGTYENDITKVSPETLKLLWRTYTGGLGQFITDTGGLANVAAQDGTNLETADVPIVKDFVKPNNVNAIRGRFYDLTKEARASITEFEQAKKAGDDEALDKIMSSPEKEELVGLGRMIRSTTKAAAGIRDEMVDINADKTLSLAEKRAKLKELEKEEEALYRDAIKAFQR